LRSRWKMSVVSTPHRVPPASQRLWRIPKMTSRCGLPWSHAHCALPVSSPDGRSTTPTATACSPVGSVPTTAPNA
jgi:hypothetical protein